jgi:hypothetical protein
MKDSDFTGELFSPLAKETEWEQLQPIDNPLFRA